MLWHRLAAAAALIRPLAWELPYATSAPLKRPKEKRKKERKKEIKDKMEKYKIIQLKPEKAEYKWSTGRRIVKKQNKCVTK